MKITNKSLNKYFLYIVLILTFFAELILIIVGHKKENLILTLALFSIVNLIVLILIYKYKKIKDIYENKLHSEREKALITLKCIGDAVITTDANGFVTLFNPVAEKLTGYLNEEVVGKYIDEVFKLINLKTKQKVFSPVQDVLKTKEVKLLANDTALISKNDEIYSIEDSAAPIKDKNNNLIGVVLVFRDVTKVKEVELKLNESEKILIQQSKMAAMGEMLENIAHQWRQPLSVISTSATGLKLKKQMDELDDEFLFKTLDQINSSSQHLSKTIDDFREFFKPNKRKEYFKILSIYDKAISLISSKFTNREIEIVSKIKDVEIFGYENELIQVFMNIFNNSIDALEKKEDIKVIMTNIYSDEKNVYIDITDNGGGVLKNIIDRVFEPYFTTKHQGQGTGIGLYMTEEIIVRHMKGKISVINKEFDYNGTDCYGAQFSISFSLK